MSCIMIRTYADPTTHEYEAELMMENNSKGNLNNQVKQKVKLVLCLTKHHTMKYGRTGVHLHAP
jgi:hypothetical protein